MWVCVLLKVFVFSFFISTSPKCVFSLEGNIKNNILLSETKLKEESQAMQISP